MPVTFQTIKSVAKKAPDVYVNACLEICPKYGIDTPNEFASFLSQMCHESAEFTHTTENLNYSAQGLANTWPTRYAVDSKAKVKVPNALALKIARKPQEIANYTYSNRNGNGDYASGDGWLFRGRGPTQLTFRGNYAKIDLTLKKGIVANPDLVLQPEIGVEVACIFWKVNNLDLYDDDVDATKESKIVNGGTLGLTHRQHYLDEFVKAFK